jgi:hypothetical protein
MTLASIAQDGDGFILQRLRIRVTFVKNSSHQRAPLDAAIWETMISNRPTGRYLQIVTVAPRDVKNEVAGGICKSHPGMDYF